jgi:hypothetical protein
VRRQAEQKRGGGWVIACYEKLFAAARQLAEGLAEQRWPDLDPI